MRRDGLGLRGLNKGLTATIGRNGTFNMIYFGFYHSVREHYPAYEVIESLFSLFVIKTADTRDWGLRDCIKLSFAFATVATFARPNELENQIAYRWIE